MFSEIRSEQKNIENFLLDDNNIFYIPDFQRNFVWGKGETEQLLADFDEDANGFEKDITKTLPGYLLGNIVLIGNDENKEKIVVDGQQRLTTLSIIAKALYDVASMRGTEKKIWTKLLGNLDNAYGVYDVQDGYKWVSQRIQHDPSLHFGNYYAALVKSGESELDGLNGDISEEIQTPEDIRINEIYEYSREYFERLDDTQLTEFLVYFKTKVKLIVTTAPNEEKAFQLFEILNDRGRSLAPTDLIKNNLLKQLSKNGATKDQIEKFIENWQTAIESLTISSKKILSSTTFLRYFLISRYGIFVKAEKLNSVFKSKEDGYAKYFSNTNEICKMAQEMCKTAEIYRAIEKEEFKKFIDCRNIFIIFKIFGIKQFHPILMMFYFAPEKKKEHVLDALVRWGAAIYASGTQMNYVESHVAKFAKDYLDEDDSELAYKKLIESINKSINDKVPDAKNNIIYKNYKGQNGNAAGKALMLLKFIEYYFNENECIRVPKESITVEHICSKKIDVDKYPYKKMGFADKNDFDDNIHRIGNLTLLYGSQNASVGSACYSDKFNHYKNSEFIMTKSLVMLGKETAIQNGKDTRIANKINRYEKQHKATKDGLWKKPDIDTRGIEIAEMFEAIITNNIDDSSLS